MKATRIGLGILGGILFVYYGLPLLNYYLFVAPYIEGMPGFWVGGMLKGLPTMMWLTNLGAVLILIAIWPFSLLERKTRN